MTTTACAIAAAALLALATSTAAQTVPILVFELATPPSTLGPEPREKVLLLALGQTAHETSTPPSTLGPEPREKVLLLALGQTARETSTPPSTLGPEPREKVLLLALGQTARETSTPPSTLGPEPREKVLLLALGQTARETSTPPSTLGPEPREKVLLLALGQTARETSTPPSTLGSEPREKVLLLALGQTARETSTPPSTLGPEPREKVLLLALGQTARETSWSALRAVAERVSGDRMPVAHAGAGAGRIETMNVHEREPRRARREERRAEKRRRTERARTEEGSALPAPTARGKWSIWARGSLAGLNGRAGRSTLEGDTTSVHLGAERNVEAPAGLERLDAGGDWLAGVGVAVNSADANPRGGRKISHQGWLVYPYLGYHDERKSLYASLGAGVGSVTVSDGVEEREQDSLQAFAGIGGTIVMAGRPDRVQVLLEGNALTSIMNRDGDRAAASTIATAHRVAAGTTLRHARELAGGILATSVGLGLRNDAGAGAAGYAVEAHAGMRFDWGQYSIEARIEGRPKAAEDIGRQLGGSASVRYAGAPGAGGFSLSIGPEPGVTLAEDPLGLRERNTEPTLARATYDGYSRLLAMPYTAFSSLGARRTAGVELKPRDNASIGVRADERKSRGEPDESEWSWNVFARWRF